MLLIALATAVMLAFAPRVLLRAAPPRIAREQSRGVSASAVSIIVPARNEATRLPRLLASLASAGATPHEVIVVDDHSTDATAAVARAGGAKVVVPEAMPSGWHGKSFACWTGARAATGSHLFFLDADVWFEPGGLAALLSRAPSDVALSICPYHRVERAYEWCSLYFNVLMVAGTQASPTALFGQSLLVPRVAYDAIGGHSAVRGEILENFELGARLRANGTETAVAIGRGTLAMRMYPHGLADLARGWMKSFARGAASTPPATLLLAVMWMGGALFALGALLSGRATESTPALILSLLALALHAVELQRSTRTIGDFPVAASVLFPLLLLFYQLAFATALLRRAVGVRAQWKERPMADGA